jgi:hypothetical protein
MSEYSRGPWRVVDTSWEKATIWSADDSLLAEVLIDGSVDEDTQDELEAQMYANARIMGRAPELLETLKRAYGLIAGGSLVQYSPWLDLAQDMKEEIEKAEG